MSRAALLVFAALAGGLLLVRQAQASTVQFAEPAVTAEPTDGGFNWPSFDGIVPSFDSETIEDGLSGAADSIIYFFDFGGLAVNQSNVTAMLSAIRAAEGTAGQPDPYRVCFAYQHTIQSLQEHPAVSGEWSGERLSDAMCAGAGFGPGCVSTAAGAYQLIKPTWLRLRNSLQLRDFGPESQDACAVELLRGCGAVARLNVGDLAGAVSKARRIWASLPGAGYGQGERSFAWLADKYQQAGGVIA